MYNRYRRTRGRVTRHAQRRGRFGAGKLRAARHAARNPGLLAALFAQRAAKRYVTPLLAAVCAAGYWLASTLFHYTVA